MILSMTVMETWLGVQLRRPCRGRKLRKFRNQLEVNTGIDVPEYRILNLLRVDCNGRNYKSN